MQEIYQPYMNLTAGQLRLLCFLAYTDHSSDEMACNLYAKGEDKTRSDVQKVLRSLKDYFKYSYYSYKDEYQLDTRHQAPLLVYLLCEHPDWLRVFEMKYKRLQSLRIAGVLTDLRLCIAGRYEPNPKGINDASLSRMLLPLSSQKAFLPLFKSFMPGLALSFLAEAEVWQVEYDIVDEDDVLGQLALFNYQRLQPSIAKTLRTIVALYNYYRRGVYDAEAAALDTLYAHVLSGLHALYAADYETAYKQLALAIREKNSEAETARKGFFNMVLDNYVLVMAYHFKENEQRKKLDALLKKIVFVDDEEFALPVFLAKYFISGTVPTKSKLSETLKNRIFPKRLYQYLAVLAVRFFGLEVDVPKTLPDVPHLHLLRHELSPWLKLGEAEKKQLAVEYGGTPLLSRIRFKQAWELLLEELTPKEVATDKQTEQQERICYVVNYDRVEIREQKRLKSGLWGAGKRVSIDSFRHGIDCMDDADRKIAASIRGWYYHDIDVANILPHLIGSDRVYTGFYAPLDSVSIVEEKPYLIIERAKNGFAVKSNMDKADLDKSVVYHKDGNFQYTVITITLQQKLYYKKLLQIGTFPLEAEPLLRQFLPKVSNVIEVHSDLVEGGTTLQHREGSPVLCLQVLPSAGSRNLFTVYCMARPLPDGVTLLDPGVGLNPCVAEADGTRYQVTRDIRGERENLQLLRTYLEDNNVLDNAPGEFADEVFAERHPVSVSAEGLLQIMLFVQEQQGHFAMEWPEGGQLHLKMANPSSWNIGLKSKNGWFEVEGEVPIDDETVLSAAQLLQLVGESGKKGFIRLGEGQFLAITERLRKQLARLESLATSNRGHLQISEMHASLLGSALEGEVTIHHDQKVEQLQSKIESSMKQRPRTPKTLRAELRDYQQDGYQWLCRMTGWGAGVCLADDMGLGKTVQTIAFLLQKQDEGPALVAAPASVVLNWRRELERFAPSLRVMVLNSVSDRQQTIDEAKAGDVVLSTYGLFVTEAEHLLKKEWNTVCLDEAHVIKNRETKTSQAVMQLQAHYRVILTGTPVQNHLGELWNLYQFINPGLLGSYDQFSQKYIVPIEQQDNKERSRQLKRIIQPFILRRTKQEVVEELPDKTEITMPVELSQEELAVYEVIRRRAKEMLEEEAGGSPSVNTLAEITRLRQAACAPQLAEKKWAGGDSSKVTMLLQLLEEIVGGGNSVLVFSQFTSFLALVREALDKGKIEYAYLDGSVPMKQRDQLVQDFQRGRQQVFLISLKAGGLGLNLTGANYVIHLDPWWNPAIEQQATDRAYRIGQRQNVTVYHLIAQHTIEEKILRLHETKRNLADAMLSGTSESHKLTSRDLLDMIGG